MSDEIDTASLDDLVVEAEETRQQYTEAQQRLSEVKQRLREHVAELREEGAPEEECDSIESFIDQGEYGAARDAIQSVREQHTLQFDDADKAAFASQFRETFEQVEADVEQIRTTLLDLQERGMTEGNMADYLYGKHSDLRKTDIEATFDAFGDIRRKGVSTDAMARVLSAYKSDLNKTAAEAVLEAIQQEADR
jgi:hypothetical protein